MKTAAVASICLAAALAVPVAPPAGAVIGHDPEAPGHSGFTVQPPTKPYLMAFHTCSANCEDPANHLIRLAESDDGAAWIDVPGWQPYRGSVPDAMRREDVLYIIGAGVTKVDLSTGATTADRISVTKQDGSPAMPRDTAFAGQLEDGRFVLAYVPPMQDVVDATSIPIYLATEVPDSDGTRFVTTGTAATVPNGVANTTGQATDPDIFFNGQTWVLYVSVGPSVVAFTAPDMAGPFDIASATVVSQQSGGVPAGIATPTGVWTFVTGGPSRDDLSIRRAVTPSGLSPVATADFTTVLTGAAYGATTAESPGLAANVPGTPCGPGCRSNAVATEPGPVQGAAVRKRTRTSATVSWTAPADDGGSAITAYQTRLRSASGRWTTWKDQSAVAGATRASHTWNRLKPGSRWRVEVRAINVIGAGDPVRLTFRTLHRA